MKSDQELLQAYAQHGSEPAFAELVQRHLDFVYSTAARLLGDPHLAQDAAQVVFLTLARSTGSLMNQTVLAGWLYRTTRNITLNVIRSNARRRSREQESALMTERVTNESDLWEQIAPHLDEAVNGLSDYERDALLLRYFQGKSAREAGEALGISAEAAQKRASRALERVRAQFAQRGIPAPAAGLAAAISVKAVQSAPAGLAIVICSKALTGAALQGAVGIGGTKLLVMTATQKVLAGATLATVLGTAMYQSYQTSTLRTELARLEAAKAEQETGFENERVELNARLAALKAAHEATTASTAEIARLRGEVARLRAAQSAFPNVRSAETQSPATNSAQTAETELPKSSWEDDGFATPEAALRTRGWCVLNGKRERFRESLFITPDARSTLENLFVRMAEMSKDPDKDKILEQVIKNQFGVEEGILMPMMAEAKGREMTGYRIVSQAAPSDEERILTVDTTWASGPERREQLRFRRFANDWKVVIDSDFLKTAGL